MARRTPLYDWHARAGAKFVEFGSWDMPLQYRGIIEEHLAVRTAAGLFDVSHMGKLVVWGTGAWSSLQHLSTNDVPRGPGRARYTHFLDASGAILDDVIVTCLDPERFVLVCNAGPRERIASWIRDHLRDAALTDMTESVLCLALQGPRAAAVLQRLTTADLFTIKPFGAALIDLNLPTPRPHLAAAPPEMKGWGFGVAGPRAASTGPPAVPVAVEEGEPVLVTRTGYTGEGGFELFPPSTWAVEVWTALLDAGRADGLVPAGLGARDTLRLERGYLLSGQDFTGRESSLEASCEWLVRWDHDFIGRGALMEQRDRGGYRRLLGLRMLDKGIPRPGCAVVRYGAVVGIATSGTFSPSLRVGIALAYLEPDVAVPGNRVEVAIRGAPHPAEVVKPPFL